MLLPRRSSLVLGSVVLAFLLAAMQSACQDVTAQGRGGAPNQKPEDLQAVLARVGKTAITVGEVQGLINAQSPYVRARYTSAEKKREYLDNLVRFELLAQEAQRRGMADDPEVVRTLKQVLVQKLLREEFDKRVKIESITDADCKAYYEAHPEEYNTPEVVRAAMILVADEKTARKVIADPRAKGPESAEFRKLVAELSTDQATRDRGGDLRYFDAQTKDLPPELVKAAFALQAFGDVSEPVKTAHGWAVLKLTGRRKAVTRPLDEVKEVIRNRLYRDRRQAAQDDYIKDLRAKGNVELHEERLSKVVVEGASSAQLAAPSPPPPGPGQFHPGAPGAPQVGPMTPGVPSGAPQIAQPPAP